MTAEPTPAWDTVGPMESVVKAATRGWHQYTVTVPMGQKTARKPGGWKYVWELTLGCGHTVLSMSETYLDRKGSPEAPRVARCPECHKVTQEQ